MCKIKFTLYWRFWARTASSGDWREVERASARAERPERSVEEAVRDSPSRKTSVEAARA
jgi:hypothetical protein